MTEPQALLRLLAWLSPAFPTGGFAYSHGLEWAVEAGEVHDGETLREWVEDVLLHGAGRSDAILLRHAHRGCGVAALARATSPSRERQLEAVAQGTAFVAAAGAWRAARRPSPPSCPGLTQASLTDAAASSGAADCRVEPGNDDEEVAPGTPYGVAIGTLAAAHGIPEDDAALAYLNAFASNLISAAVRLVPLGQSAGLAVLAALEPTLLAVADATRKASLDDIGGCAFRADVASMRHETQYTRLFRS